MRLSTIVLLLQFIFAGSVLSAHRASAQNLDQQVSLNLQGTSLREALTAIEKQCNIRFIAQSALLQGQDKKVTLSTSRITVRRAIGHLLDNTNLRYRLVEGHVVIEPKPAPKAKPRPQQPGRIAGTVLDDKGEPLPGASVKVVQTNQSVQSNVDGSYSIPLPAGEYTLEVSFVGYRGKRITDVALGAGQVLRLDVVLQTAPNVLEQATVTTSYSRETVAGFLAQQRNAASITDGISAEQIARTPDNNIGQALKRVSGVVMVGDRYAVVRGLGDRYNQAMIDGIVLPSTSMNRRNFSFDALPKEVVGSIVVNKTATPDVGGEFAGGQLSVNTLAIPDRNFTSVSIGAGASSQAFDTDFRRLGKAGSTDWLGFDDGDRKAPGGIKSWYWHNQVNVLPPGDESTADLPLLPGAGSEPYSSLDALAQSKRFKSDPLKPYGESFMPNLNGSIGLGRVYDIPDRGWRLGFVAGLGVRNSREISSFNNVRGQDYSSNFLENGLSPTEQGAGTAYRFNASTGIVANIGLEGERFSLTLRNLYTSRLEDNFFETKRLTYRDLLGGSTHEQFQEPMQTNVLQHKLEGHYDLPRLFRVDYYGSFNDIRQQVLDQRKLKYTLSARYGGVDYHNSPNFWNLGITGDAVSQDSRMWTDTKEHDFNWGVAFSRRFGEKSWINTLAKVGYQGWQKDRLLSVTRMIPWTMGGAQNIPYHVQLAPENIGTGAFYWAEHTNGPAFEGVMKSHAGYLMLDQLLFKKLRMVYGVRGEHYHLSNDNERYLRAFYGGDIPSYYSATVEDKMFKWLPSANLTYHLSRTINVRASYGKTAIRPDFRETGIVGFYDFELDGNISGRPITSTYVDNIDLRWEWYPSPEEVVTVSGFYKYLDKPIELVKNPTTASSRFRFQNQHSAKNYGVELEFRKHLGFIADAGWLRDIYLFGNGTVLKSEVTAMSFPALVKDEQGDFHYESHKIEGEERPLYGQSPWIVNAGLSYLGERYGATASYNRSGERTFTLSLEDRFNEFENGVDQLDLQLYGRFLKRRNVELKLNLSNLLDPWRLFYVNLEQYKQSTEQNPDGGGYALVHNKGTNAYKKADGDIVNYRDKRGRNFSFTLSWRF